VTKEEVIEKIQYATMQVASVYACSVIFDEKTKVIEGRQKELEKAIVNLHNALKELED
jgi:prefoldin subunit 5